MHQKTKQQKENIKNVNVPEGTYTMSPSDYDTYRKDGLDYQILTQYSNRQIVLQMRLNKDIDLKRSADINSGTQWDAFTVEVALDAVQTVVLHTSNIAVLERSSVTWCNGMGNQFRNLLLFYLSLWRPWLNWLSFNQPFTKWYF